MPLYDFMALDEMEQVKAVWNGVHIADREGIIRNRKTGGYEKTLPLLWNEHWPLEEREQVLQ